MRLATASSAMKAMSTLAVAQASGLKLKCRSCGAAAAIEFGRLLCSADRRHMDLDGRVERARAEMASRRRLAELKRLIAGG